MATATHAYLPGKFVAAACEYALREIKQERVRVLYDIAGAKRRADWKLRVFTTTAGVAQRLTAIEKALAEKYRADDAQYLTTMKALSTEAVRTVPDGIVMVTVDDFARIHEHYKRVANDAEI